jgi:hypothetical protein
MRLLTYRVDDRESFGAVSGDQVIDGPALFTDRSVGSVRKLLELDLVAELRRRLPDANATHSLTNIEYLPR